MARRRMRGFTLVEVLVALFVMALMAALAWRGLDGVLRARDAGRAAVDRTMLLATVLAQFETDLQALQLDDTVPGALNFDGRTLRLLRRAGGGLQIVAWTFDGSSWQRWASPPVTTVLELQQTWLRSQQLQGAQPAPLKLIEGVGDFQLFCLFGASVSNCQSSRDQDSSSGASSGGTAGAGIAGAAAAQARSSELLPGGVRLVLQIDGKTLTRDLAVAPGQ